MALTKAHSRMIEGAAVNVLDFGAVGDGTADDTAAIQAAIDYARLSSNGTVIVPDGTYLVSQTIIIKGVIVIGLGGRTRSTIKASSSNTFTSGRVISIGENSAREFIGRIENITVDCNNVSGTVGIYSGTMNNSSGIRDVFVQAAGLYGVYIDGTNTPEQPQLFNIENIEVSMSKDVADGGVSTSSSIGFYLDLRNNCAITMGSNLHVTTTGATTSFAGSAFRFEGVSGTYTNIHAERCAKAGIIGQTSPCIGLAINGVNIVGATCPEGIRISNSPATKSRFIDLKAIRTSDVTTIPLIIDEISLGASYPISDTDFSNFSSNDSSIFGVKQWPDFPLKAETPAVLASGNVTLSPQVTTDIMRLQAAGAGSDIIGIANGRHGRKIKLTCLNSNPLVLKFNSGSAGAGEAIATPTGADVTITAGTAGRGPLVELVYDGSTQVWRMVGV